LRVDLHAGNGGSVDTGYSNRGQSHREAAIIGAAGIRLRAAVTDKGIETPVNIEWRAELEAGGGVDRRGIQKVHGLSSAGITYWARHGTGTVAIASVQRGEQARITVVKGTLELKRG
jgi:hypothetical protein